MGIYFSKEKINPETPKTYIFVKLFKKMKQKVKKFEDAII
jgi:hypothetical protein